MTSRDFCYWLQGLFEVSEVTELNSKQVEIIKNHLAMVFVHEIDPSFGGKEKQDKLNTIHNGRPPLMKC
mgnify:CR=1 FL=1|jgi:hypothetical protein